MFSKNFVLLQQEAFLVRSCICVGLDSLIKANLHEKGKFYTSFFQLSIGMERLMKIIIIVEHSFLNEHGDSLNNRKLKQYGHNIIDLFKYCLTLVEKHQLKEIEFSQNDIINIDILNFLTEFAKITRYHNIDSMVGTTNTIDPLSSWNMIINKILSQDVPEAKIKTVVNQTSEITGAVKDISSVIAHNLDKDLLEHDEYFIAPALIDLTAPFCVYRIYSILKILVDIVVGLSDKAHLIDSENSTQIPNVPYMREFFTFMLHNRSEVLRKRRWP